MTLREKTNLVEKLTSDKDFAKMICDNFIFDVDISESSENESKFTKPNKDGNLDVYKLRCFRIKCSSFIDLCLDAPSFLEALKNGDNIRLMLMIIKLICNIVSSLKMEITDDHAIFLACLAKMTDKNGKKQQVEEDLYTFCNKIKSKLNQKPLDICEFHQIVNDLLSFKIITMEDGRIILEDKIIHKTSLYKILTNPK